MALVLKNIFTPGTDEIAQSYIIESWHISQSVDALTGKDAYNITISGSLNLTGSSLTGSTANITSITGSLNGTATTASYVQTAKTASYVQTAQTASYVQTAQTASYVALAQSSTLALSVSGSYIPTGSTSPLSPASFKFVSGYSKTDGGGTSTVNIPELGVRNPGQNVFITTGVSGSSPSLISYVANGPSINFYSTPPAPNTEFTYLVMYI